MTATKPRSMSDLTGPFGYLVHTVNAWRVTGQTFVWANSAQEVLDHAVAMGYAKVDVAPAAPVNGFPNTPHQSGDTASFGYERKA